MTASSDTINPHGRANGIIHAAILIIFIIAPVLTPLPYIATHVVNTEFIWLFLTPQMGHLAGVFTMPAYRVKVIAPAILVAAALLPTFGRIFPLASVGKR